jgi:uncharacterized repeat protein (TIGR03847 family)
VSRRIFQYEHPDRFCTGTVGEPGQRTFYLQASKGESVTAVALEKVQVAVLADRIIAVIQELQRRGTVAAELVPEGDDDQALLDPLDEEFRVGNMTIAWDEEHDELVLEARSVGADDETEEDVAEVPDDALEGPDVLRVRITPQMAIGFSQRAQRIVAAGRPPCPFCGQPLDPGGHLCPRRNGTGYLH